MSNTGGVVAGQLQTLLVSASSRDAETLLTCLRSDGWDAVIKRVNSEEGLRSTLKAGHTDLLFVDLQHGRVSAKAATDIVDAAAGDVPVLVVADVNEGSVIAAMEGGAHVFIPRGDLSRLGPAVERELVEAERRREGRRATASLAENERFLKDVFESVQDGVSILDTDMTIMRVNPTMERWFPHAVPLAGKKCHEAYQCRSEPCVDCPVVISLHTGDSSHQVVPWKGADAETIGWLDLFSFPLVDSMTGEMTGVIQNVRDVTEQRKIEDLKSDLVSMVSHELRTPLASIVGYSAILSRDDIGEPANRRLFEKAVAKIGAQSKHMSRLVDSLLEVSRIQAGNLELSLAETDVSHLVHVCVDSVALTDRHELEIDVAPDLPSVTCDPARLSWAITNVISNAVKFSPEGGTITVRVEVDSGRLRISVADEGIGITAEDMSLVFDRFMQADMSATRQFNGFGMGLFTAKAVVEAHAGQIQAESRPGAGSTFIIDIPCAGPLSRAV